MEIFLYQYREAFLFLLSPLLLCIHLTSPYYEYLGHLQYFAISSDAAVDILTHTEFDGRYILG